MFEMLKRCMLAGLLFWVPLIVTIACVYLLVDIVASMFLFLPDNWHPDYLIGVNIPGIEMVVVVCVVLLTGLLVANFIGRKVVDIGESFVEKVPLVRSVYTGVKQVMQIMVKSDTTAFRKVCLITFPKKDSWVIGLVTQVIEGNSKDDEAWVIFVPTSPNPTSGYVVTVYHKDAIELDMTVDEALKYIISLGTLSHDALNKAFKRLTTENKK